MSKLLELDPTPSSAVDTNYVIQQQLYGLANQDVHKTTNELPTMGYNVNGDGYAPSTPSVDRLPSNVYKIEVINNIYTFLKHSLSTDKLITLPDSKSEKIINEIKHFWTLKDKFKKFGFAHKRGILLYGPQGSGKTTTISILCDYMLKNDGIVILFNDQFGPGIVSFMLSRLRKVEPDRQVMVILEDIDSIVDKFGETETLSILDGESSIDNVIYIGTTNYPEKLDKRITDRPSRFDRVVEIGMPNKESRKIYIESRGLPLSSEEIELWVEKTEGLGIAHIKELIVSVCCLGNTFDVEIERLHGMKKTPTSTDNKPKMGFG